MQYNMNQAQAAMDQKSHPPKSLKLVTPGSSQDDVPKSTYKPTNRIEPNLGIPSEFGSIPRPAAPEFYSAGIEGKALYARKMRGRHGKRVTPLIWLCLGLTVFALAGYGYYDAMGSSTTRLSKEARLYEHQALRAGFPPATDIGAAGEPMDTAAPGDVGNLTKGVSTKVIDTPEETDQQSAAAIAEKLKDPASSMSLPLSSRTSPPTPLDAMPPQKKPATSRETVASDIKHANGATASASDKQTARAFIPSFPERNSAAKEKIEKAARPPASSCNEAMIAMRLCEADEQ